MRKGLKKTKNTFFICFFLPFVKSIRLDCSEQIKTISCSLLQQLPLIRAEETPILLILSSNMSV